MKSELKWVLLGLFGLALGAIIASLAFWPTAALSGVLLWFARVVLFFLGWTIIVTVISVLVVRIIWSEEDHRNSTKGKP